MLPNPSPSIITVNDLVLGDTAGTPLSASTGPLNKTAKEIQQNAVYLDALSISISANTISLATSATTLSASISAHSVNTSTHGVSGSIVGTQNIQSLSNKTLLTPTVSGFNNANHTHTNASQGGVLGASAISSVLGTYDNTKVIDTLYQAATDIFVILKTGNNGNQVTVSGQTGATSGALVEIAYAKSNQSTEAETLQLYFFVNKNYFWKIVTANSPNSPVINIISFGT